MLQGVLNKVVGSTLLRKLDGTGVGELVMWPQRQLDMFSKLHRRPGWLERSKEGREWGGVDRQVKGCRTDQIRSPRTLGFCKDFGFNNNRNRKQPGALNRGAMQACYRVANGIMFLKDP